MENVKDWLDKKGYYNSGLRTDRNHRIDLYLSDVLDEYRAELLRTHNVVVELPKANSKEFKDWLKTEGYKNKGFGIYQKEDKDYCYKLLYKHYCNTLGFGN